MTSQLLVLHDFDVVLCFAEFGEPVLRYVLVNSFTSTQSLLIEFEGSHSFVRRDRKSRGAVVLTWARSGVVVWNSARILCE
jgi:hypothetical protein